MSLRQQGRRAIRMGVFAAVILSSIVAGSTQGWGVAGTVWTTLPTMPTPRDELAAVTAACPTGQKASCVYVLGGLNDGGIALPTAESYNAGDDAWTTLAPMLTGQDGLAAAAGPCPSGQSGTCVYAIGGFSSAPPGTSAMVESYNPSTNAWSADASLPTARDFLAAAAGPCPSGQAGTCIYAIGGLTNTGITAAVESYNPTTNAWSTDAALPTARYFLAAAAGPCPAGQTGTCVYAAGGDTMLSNSPAATVESYNPSTNAWSTDAALPTARDELAAATAGCPAGQIGTCIYAVGGSNTQVVGGNLVGGTLGTNESYNPVTNAWTTLTPMPTPRSEVAAAASACPPGETGTCIYVAGGANAGSVLNTLQAFDPPLSKHSKKN